MPRSAAVERLIFYDPDNAALQLEAARLYLQIKSYAAAAGYLKDAVAIPGLTDAQLDEIAALTRQADRGARGSPWSGFGQVGARYQTNANIGSVELGLNEPFPFEKPQPDWNAFALGTLGLDTPLNKNMSIEGSLSGYYADQRIVDRLDLGFAELAVGPGSRRRRGALGQALRAGAWHPARRRPLRGGLWRRVRCSAGFSPTAGGWSRSSNTRTGPTTTRSTTPTRRTRRATSTPMRSTSAASFGEREPAHRGPAINDNYGGKGLPELRPVFRQCRAPRLRSTPSARRAGRSRLLPPSLIPISKASLRLRSSRASRPCGGDYLGCRRQLRGAAPRKHRAWSGVEYNQNISNVDRDDYENWKVRDWPAGQI